jgi:hypothetical protein
MPNATKQTDPEPPVEEEKKKIVQENVPKPLNTVKEEKTIEQQPVPRPLNAIKEEKTIEQQPVPRPLNAIKERKERGGMTL